MRTDSLRPPEIVHEVERLEALRRTGLLDTPPEKDFDDLTRLAALICEVPIAIITLIDEDRQWFKSKIGLEATQSPRSISFCAHAIAGDEAMIVPDAHKDERFATNPLVLRDPKIRFYAGMPIAGPDGHNLGTICVIDREPRQLSEPCQVALRVLARQAATLIMNRIQVEALNRAAEQNAIVERQLRESQEQLQQANQRLEQLVRTDALTGLGNRRLFDERLRQEWKLSQRLGIPLSLVMIDIDRFKHINDTAGHPVGDAVLRHVGELLIKLTRESDTCTRYGGEEFAVLLPATSLPHACEIADRLRRRISENPFGAVSITVSMGISADNAATSTGTAAAMVERADRALYDAKAGGRNCVMCAAE